MPDEKDVFINGAFLFMQHNTAVLPAMFSTTASTTAWSSPSRTGKTNRKTVMVKMYTLKVKLHSCICNLGFILLLHKHTSFLIT